MAEKIISPGVFTRENDLSFVQTGVAAIGAAIIGPTVKGPAMIPTLVFSYSEYQALFGDSFKSGSDYYQYLTSITAKEYLKHGGPATVTRILPGAYANATASAHMERTAVAGQEPSSSLAIVTGGTEGVRISYTASDGDTFLFLSEDEPNIPQNNETDGIYYFVNHATSANFVTNFIAGNPSESSGAGITFAALTGDTAAVGAAGFIDFTGSNGTFGEMAATSHSALTEAIPATAGTMLSLNASASVAALTVQPGVPKSGSTGDDFTASFAIKTVSDGLVMNSTPIDSSGNLAVGTNDIYTKDDIKYGTKDNLRWQISTVLPKKGTFTLLVRRGDDSSKRKVILETWSGCSLDPQTNNYLGSVVGTAFNTIGNAAQADIYIQPSGSWPNRSKYIYIDENSVLQTVDYLDDNGNLVDTTATASLPMLSSGSFGGGSDGDMLLSPNKFYQDIEQTNVQGVNALLGQTGNQAYLDAINLMSNQDEFDINLIVTPGINDNMHNNITEKLLTMCEERGDVMTIIDPVPFGKEIANAVTEANDKDSSYGAMYWPWVQIADSQTGRYVWVPQSTIMPGIYAFNDKVSAEWFAPAGLNRGGQEIVVQAERKLTHSNRDTLYEANVNPVATFPGEGVVVWGQKTLQKKSSALDRVNVRRLLINLKKFIASVSKYLIFENNTATTRNRFLSQVNPYMESVQQRQGLYAFKVVMDESNNTPDVIDRNIMKGDIFIQPAKAAEFIVIDFNVMPTGATFND